VCYHIKLSHLHEHRETEMMNIAFTKKSSNKKVGPIPVTTSSKDSCPPSCPLLNNGCYASAGFHTNMHWNKVTSGERGTPIGGLCTTIAALKPDTLWRHNVAGDLIGTDDIIAVDELEQLVNANRGRRGFTYTHYPLHKSTNLHMVTWANDCGFTVNVSTNTVAEALATQEATGLPVVTIVPPEFWAEGDRREGVLRCPAETRDEVTCKSCQLCQRGDRKDIIGFTVHGTSSKKAQLIARG
jgi:hypothetical protein